LLAAFGTSTCNVACAAFPRSGIGKGERAKGKIDDKTEGNREKGKEEVLV
jgi:hypothetical protein